MIKEEKLSYSFPQKDLYNKISFTLEDDVHCAFIGTNGTGIVLMVIPIVIIYILLQKRFIEGASRSGIVG